MKKIKLLLFSLILMFTACATYQVCPAYSKLDKQNTNQNQTEMRITKLFIEPSYVPQMYDDILIFENGHKGVLQHIVISPTGKLYYGIYNTQGNAFTTSAEHIHYVEQAIVGICNLPPTQDLINQLEPGDKVLLKTLKDNPYPMVYKRKLNKQLPFNDILSKAIRQLGKEITIRATAQTCRNNNQNKQILSDTNSIIWFSNEIAKITFIKKQNDKPNKIG